MKKIGIKIPISVTQQPAFQAFPIPRTRPINTHIPAHPRNILKFSHYSYLHCKKLNQIARHKYIKNNNLTCKFYYLKSIKTA